MHARALISFLVLSAVVPASAQHREVTAVRHWTFAGVTRIAIETSGETPFHAGRLANPDRLIFDLYGAVPRKGSKRFAHVEIGDTLVKRVRMAEVKRGVTRVVLDLEAAVDYHATQLSNPDRLIVELRPRNAPVQRPMMETRELPVIQIPVRRFEPPPQPVPVFATIQPMSAPPSLYVSLSPVPRARRIFTFTDLRVAPPPVVLALREREPVVSQAPQVPPAPVLHPEPKTLRERPAEKATFNSSARAAKLAATQSMTRALGLKINRVVIDAGHGGHDQGTSGPNGLLEKDLTLDVAQRLGKLIEQHLGSEVIYTRSDDTYIGLKERTSIANRSKADLFLSIHANSSPASSVTGVETYYLNFTNSAESLSLAARENATSENSVYELKDLIQTITLHEKIEESKEFASCVQTSLQNFENRSFPQSKNRGIRKAPFVVLIGASMPSILAEVGFISNSHEESQLSKSAYRQKLAEALYAGVSKYAGSLSHFSMGADPVAADLHSDEEVTRAGR